ncbi:MAG: tRNA lysidine(34) synthetase TilS [Methylicorpusculum sp.]|uniref:tRNA lysidine(34) synthetase TilS n=1 Tax=Methylicorpusculum sp. TaxID=2713644 RepID=UPI0027189F6E|nr:tRNA lysidine(34) synthetase TilS [Methylicorpusculum sp.]MDO8941241.1 tRNA lysidine(34) synthetase TilS [Methylicorpusculum sp.]
MEVNQKLAVGELFCLGLMTNIHAQSVESHLIDTIRPYQGSRRVFVAYSGGVDSHVLLHLCAQQHWLKEKLTAVYVHHGLQAIADHWALHCQATATALDIAFKELRVDARPVNGQSPEEAARNARYGVLSSLLDDQDLLLVAQHREDQLETVLLQLFRGAGLPGLSGMPVVMPMGKGILLRPLLNVSKQEIEAYAAGHELDWVEDPTNQSTEFDRNFLRNDVLPVLKKRWPALDKTVSRAAGHCAEAQAVIRQEGGELLKKYLDIEFQALSLELWSCLENARQALLLRAWFGFMGLRMPSRRVIHQIINEVIDTAETGKAEVFTQGYAIRRFRNRLYCFKSKCFQLPEIHDFEWSSQQACLDLSEYLKLQRIEDSCGIAIDQWKNAKITVAFRRGGETIRLPGRKGRHTLKNLFQEAAIPPWERPVIPLVYLDGQLAAVADRWISDEFYTVSPGACYRIKFIKQTPG